MAIKWNLEPTIISIAASSVSVVATRTDETDPDNPRVYRVEKGYIDSGANRLKILDKIWDQHQTALANESASSTFLGDLVAAGEANLEARE